MGRTVDDGAFWERVDHRMKVKQPFVYLSTQLMLRLGILIILFTATYLVLGMILSPAQGYFLSNIELAVHPIFWALCGIGFIIGGAIVRFRAMGPIMEEIKDDSDL